MATWKERVQVSWNREEECSVVAKPADRRLQRLNKQKAKSEKRRGYEGKKRGDPIRGRLGKLGQRSEGQERRSEKWWGYCREASKVVTAPRKGGGIRNRHNGVDKSRTQSVSRCGTRKGEAKLHSVASWLQEQEGDTVCVARCGEVPKVDKGFVLGGGGKKGLGACSRSARRPIGEDYG